MHKSHDGNAELDGQAKADSKLEFAKLLALDQSRLYGYLHSLVHDVNDADDLFQRVSLVLWQKLGEFDRQRRFFPWACGIARLEVANFLRSRSRHRLYFSDEVNLMLVEAWADVPNAEFADRREALAHCIDRLRQKDRELIEQCYGEEAGIQKAAEALSRSSHSIYNSVRRIRRALFECVRSALALETRPGDCRE